MSYLPKVAQRVKELRSELSSTDAWFSAVSLQHRLSDLTVQQNQLEGLLKQIVQGLYSVLERVQECAFLTSFRVMLMLLVLGPHFLETTALYDTKTALF